MKNEKFTDKTIYKNHSCCRNLHVGTDGEGASVFPNLETDQAAIRIDSMGERSVGVTIRDLSIYGPGSSGAEKSGRGLDLTNSSMVTINNVRVSEFKVGIYGWTSFSVLMQQCNRTP